MNNEFIIDVPSKIMYDSELNEILLHMDKNSGSDVFIMGGLPITMRRYGRNVQVSRRTIKDKEAVNILAMMYGDNAASLLGEGKQIDTAHDFRVQTGIDEYDNELFNRYRFRVNGVSCERNGNRSATITIRSIPTMPKRTADLGIEKEIVDVFMKSQQGLALVVGATGNGKSTTLAALIRDMLEDPEGHRNFVTIEAPIEFVHDGYYKPNSIYTQLEVGKHIQNFGEGVRNAMRMAPTSILVGETRDYETASASVEASRTGHFVASTLHANSVDSTFQRLIGLYPENMQAIARLEAFQELNLVVAQRLIPTVDGGRTAIRSFLVLDQQIKNKLFEAKNVAGCAFDLVNKHGKPMMDDVETKYRAGQISKIEYEKQKFTYDQTREMYQ